MMAKLTHVEVQNTFLREGVLGVARIIEDASASAYTLRRALRELQDAPGTLEPGVIAELESLLAERGFLSTTLTKPDVGEERDYTIQEDSGRLVLKLPVDYLGRPKGRKLRVKFEVNGGRFYIPPDEE